MINDLKAPRFNKRTFRKNIVCEELYKEWKIKTGRKESFKQFRDIWNKIADEVVNQVIEERDGVRLAKGMGDLYIGFLPGFRNPIDYKLSEVYGKPIFYQNFDSNGKMAKIIHGTRRRKYIFRLYKFWNFTPHRLFKRRVIEALKTNPERYKNSIEKR